MIIKKTNDSLIFNMQQGIINSDNDNNDNEKFDLLRKDLLHCGHLNGLFSSWTESTCIFILLFSEQL